eukprot:3920265-Alexandrium_andersonii.AAC.1
MPGGKGLMDLIIAKREIGQLLVKWAENDGVDPNALSLVTSWLFGHQEYRAYVSYPGKGTVDES